MFGYSNALDVSKLKAWQKLPRFQKNCSRAAKIRCAKHFQKHPVRGQLDVPNVGSL